jgi:DnaJ-class molecular chaperone
MNKKFSCQECGGGGDITDDVIEGYPIYVQCACCNGTGKVTAQQRGQWLTHRREESRDRKFIREKLESASKRIESIKSHKQTGFITFGEI